MDMCIRCCSFGLNTPPCTLIYEQMIICADYQYSCVEGKVGLE